MTTDPSALCSTRSSQARALVRRPRIGLASVGALALLLAAGAARADLPAVSATAAARVDELCADDVTLATGRPDPALFALEASQGVRAFWCETYDESGRSRREGPYVELHPNGALRARAHYVDRRLGGPVEAFLDDGTLWLRGELGAGGWTGVLEIFHPNGEPWFAARFDAGRLDGAVETRFPDGQLESRTQFHDGREHGIATHWYPASAGGRVRSRVRVRDKAETASAVGEQPARTASLP